MSFTTTSTTLQSVTKTTILNSTANTDSLASRVSMAVSEEVVASSFAMQSLEAEVLNEEMQQDSVDLDIVKQRQQEYFSSDDLDKVFVLTRCQLPDLSEYSAIETFVEKAVREQHCEKDDSFPKIKAYKGILDALRFQSDKSLLRKILLALRTSGNGATLHLLTSSSSKHARLVHLIVRLNPFEPVSQGPANGADSASSPSQVVDYDLADAQLHLLLALVSANSVFLVPALLSLWKLLALSPQRQAASERTNRLHAALASMVRLCPKAKSELFPMMSTNAPYRTRPEDDLIWYHKQCLIVLNYHPSIQGLVLELIVDKCIELDVEIKINDGGVVTLDNEKEDMDDALFQIELEPPKPESQVLSSPGAVDETANKLDALMLLLFEFIETHTTRFGHSSIAGLYNTFMRIFESSILITYKSKFVQFVVLYICALECDTAKGGFGLDQGIQITLYREFAAKLIDVLLDPYRATVTRQSAACYLASFVSRASFICAETVCESVSALLRWAEAYMQTVDFNYMHSNDSRGKCALHSLFYTVCQSAFYIMCFRGVEAITFFRQVGAADNDDFSLDPNYIDVGAERWTRICEHPLQPLRFCLESVRLEFLTLAETCRLIDSNVLERLTTECHDAISNVGILSSSSLRRKQLQRRRSQPIALKLLTPVTLEKERVAGGVGGLGQGTNPLDSFFPFDPFLLRRSYVYIEPHYRHWSELDYDSLHLLGDQIDDEIRDSANVDDEHEIISVSDNEGNDNSSDESDDEINTEASGSVVQPMSLMSHNTSIASLLELGSPPLLNKESLSEAWMETWKQPRAPSVENGSW